MTETATALAAVYDLFARIENATNTEEMLDLIVVLRDVKREVDILTRDADKIAVETLGGMKEWTIGKHAVEIRSSKQRRWTDVEGLRTRVGLVARFDPATGEERTATEAVEILTAAYRCGGAEARTTWLKQHDIDPDDYSEGTWRATCAISLAPISAEQETA